MTSFLKTSATAIRATLVDSQAWAQAGPVQDQSSPWHMMHGWSGGWEMIFGPLYMIAWLAILVAVILLLVRWMGVGGSSPIPPARSAREILDERFAKGEIDQEEYERRRGALNI